MNDIQTWQQGEFIDKKEYKHFSNAEKRRCIDNESKRVRPMPTENAICVCDTAEHAKWIANRLNLASILEEMSYNYATGKSDGQDIVDYVHKSIRGY